MPRLFSSHPRRRRESALLVRRAVRAWNWLNADERMDANRSARSRPDEW